MFSSSINSLNNSIGIYLFIYLFEQQRPYEFMHTYCTAGSDVKDVYRSCAFCVGII